MSIASQAREIVEPYKHPEGYSEVMARWRGLVRSYENMEDRAAGKPPKRRKRRGNTGGDTNSQEE